MSQFDLTDADRLIATEHVQFAEREAAKTGLPADTAVRDVHRVAVIGAGTMGGGIAMAFANAGFPVTLIDADAAGLARGVQRLRDNYATSVQRGKLTPEAVEQRLSLITGTTALIDAVQADLFIEAVFEDMALKQRLFRELDGMAKPGAILATNTSGLDIGEIARVTGRPQDVVGAHFFSPAHVMRLLEVVRSKHTAKDVMATVMAVAKKIKKVAVVSGVCDGFIGNRMIEQYSRQAGFLLDEGCTPQQVDKAVEKWGMAMGPFRMGDLAGNDIGWAIRKRRYQEKPDMRYSATADKLCELGRFGQKTAAGWYDYEAGKRDPVPSAVVEEMLVKHRESLGITPRQISDEEIVGRLILALVNEGAYILEEGIASKASDIDMVYLTGYGFPLFRGGPMLYADILGLDKVVAQMAAYAQNPQDDATFWQPAPVLAKLAAEGKSFNNQA